MSTIVIAESSVSRCWEPILKYLNTAKAKNLEDEDVLAGLKDFRETLLNELLIRSAYNSTNPIANEIYTEENDTLRKLIGTNHDFGTDNIPALIIEAFGI